MVSVRVALGTPSHVGNLTRMLDVSRSDVALLEDVRRGDVEAYDILYARHVDAARRLARSLLRSQADADDVVSEVFASVLDVVQRGKGPRDSFSPYLMASVRNESYRVQRRHARDAPWGRDDLGVEPDPFARRDEAEMLQQALESLPSRFREVLWRTEVEGQSHQRIADDTGTTAQAVAAQAMRARRALGDAYLRGHLPITPVEASRPHACVSARGHLAELVRGSLSRRRRRRVEAHLAGCESCRAAREELDRINQHLRAAPAFPVSAGAVLLRRGLKDRLIGLFGATGAPLVAATSLVLVSGVVPFVVAHRASGDDRVTTIAAPTPRGVESAATPAFSTTRVRPADDPPAATEPSPPRHRAEPDSRRRREPTRHTRSRTPNVPLKHDRPRERVRTQPAPTDAPPPASVPPAESAPPTVTVLPPISVPAVSTPAVSLPPVSTPVVTVPSVTVPSVTVPPVTVPPVTVPPVTVPPTTLPPVTVPAPTVPPVTVPPVTLPPIGG